MSFVAARCTQCGAKIKIDDSKEAGICEFCGTAFITEKAINNYNNFIRNEYHIDNAVIQGGKSIDEMLANAEVFLNVHHDYDKAFELFQKCADEAPGDYRGWLGMAKAEYPNEYNLLTIDLYCEYALNVVPPNERKTVEEFRTKLFNDFDESKRRAKKDKALQIELNEKEVSMCQEQLTNIKNQILTKKKDIAEAEQNNERCEKKKDEYYAKSKKLSIKAPNNYFAIMMLYIVCSGIFALFCSYGIFSSHDGYFLKYFFEVWTYYSETVNLVILLLSLTFTYIILILIAVLRTKKSHKMTELGDIEASKIKKSQEEIKSIKAEICNISKQRDDLMQKIESYSNQIKQLKSEISAIKTSREIITNSVQGSEAFICGQDGGKANACTETIEPVIVEPKIGDIYKGKVVRVKEFGAFVEFAPGKEGMVHISELEDIRVAKVEDVCNVGDQIMVKIIKIDNQGRYGLSRKEALADIEAKEKVM